MITSTQSMITAALVALLSSSAAQAAGPVAAKQIFVLAPVIVTAHRIDPAHRLRMVQAESRKAANERAHAHG